MKNCSDPVIQLKQALTECSSVVIGAGAGLSTAAGFIYTGERFEKYFSDFIGKYHFPDMYAGGFFPFETKGEFWAYWSRYIYINRYMDPPGNVYRNLLKTVRDKEYFVITTNVDHCFQKAGFDRKRLFYTQGDYGLFQCSEPCHQKTYDNREIITDMVLAQGFEIGDQGELIVPERGNLKTEVPESLFPVCPVCGKEMTMNLRSDDRFVQDEGWYEAAERYQDFVNQHRSGKILYLEAGVGFNTPSIIKYPFWQLTFSNPEALYVCLNHSEAFVPKEIEKQSLCIAGDADAAISRLLNG